MVCECRVRQDTGASDDNGPWSTSCQLVMTELTETPGDFLALDALGLGLGEPPFSAPPK